MHSGFEIPGHHHHHHHQPPPENAAPPLLLSMNPTHILDQIHTQHLPLDHHHHNLLPPHHHHYSSAAAPYYPLNFKLGLNEICSRNAPHSPPLGMLDPPFWEPLQAEASNENSEELNHRETPTNCLDAKTRLHFSELDAIYKRLGNSETNQTTPTRTTLPALPEQEEPPTLNPSKKKSKSKKKKPTTPMAEFFEDLVKQVMEHQENLQKKFTEVMERLNEERREREEAWRNQELAHLEREAAARAREKAMAKSREAMIVSYLEKITGRRINLPPPEITATNASDGSNGPQPYC